MNCTCIACRTERYVREWADGKNDFRPPDDMIQRWIQIRIRREEIELRREEREDELVQRTLSIRSNADGSSPS